MARYAVIVDPFGSGRELGPAFRARGVEPVAVLSRPEPPPSYAATWVPGNHAHVHVHDGDLDALADLVRRYDPLCVIPGSEPGVDLAEALCARVLPGEANVPALAAARRDKWEMAQALERAGVPHLRQFCSADPAEIEAWLRASGLAGQRLVVKPPKSVGADEVHMVSPGADWRPYFDRIIGRENKAGVRNDGVLVEEFCAGAEYIVDSYSVDGRHGLVDVCRYNKLSRDDRIGIYDRVDFLPPDHPDVAVLWDYTRRVLDAVGIRNGCGHAEVMLTDDGARLVEVAARLAGAAHQQVSKLATGDNHVERAVRHHLDGAFRPDFDWVQHVRVVFLSAPRSGVWRNGAVFDEVDAMPTVAARDMLYRAGEVVPATNDIFTPLGLVMLASPDPAAIERDYARLKELESRVVIEPVELPDQPYDGRAAELAAAQVAEQVAPAG